MVQLPAVRRGLERPTQSRMLGCCACDSSTGPRPEAPLSRPKVLIADDSPLVLRMIEKMLEARASRW